MVLILGNLGAVVGDSTALSTLSIAVPRTAPYLHGSHFPVQLVEPGVPLSVTFSAFLVSTGRERRGVTGTILRDGVQTLDPAKHEGCADKFLRQRWVPLSSSSNGSVCSLE